MRTKKTKSVKNIKTAKLKRAEKNYREIMKRLKPYLPSDQATRLVKHSDWKVGSRSYIIKQSDEEHEL